MTQVQLAEELAKDHARLLDLIKRFNNEDVEDRYEILLDNIADRLGNGGFAVKASTFRPHRGIANSYGSRDPGAALARMRGHANKLEAIIEDLRLKAEEERKVISHRPEDIANDLQQLLDEVREISAEYPNGRGSSGLPDVLRKIAARLIRSGLHENATRFDPDSQQYIDNKSIEFRVTIGRDINSLAEIVTSMRKDPDSWIPKIERGLGIAIQQPMRDQPARTEVYVSQEKIEELERLKPLLEGIWDLSALIELLDGINANYAAERYLPVAILVRATMDHVPPLFGQPNFQSVIAQSKKSEATIYDRAYGAKDIADFWIHQQIRAHIVMPDQNVVDKKADFNFLIGRVIELLRAAVPTS